MSNRKDKKLDDTMDFPKIRDNVIDIKSKKPVSQMKPSKNVKTSKTSNTSVKTKAQPQKQSPKVSVKQKKKKNKSKSGILFGRLFRLLIVVFIVISVIGMLATVGIQAFFKVETIQVIYNGKELADTQDMQTSASQTQENDDSNLYIKKQTAQNSNRYTKEDIVDNLTIRVGDNLVNADKKVAADNLKQKLPYIGTVVIKKKLPHIIVVTVKETNVKWLFQYGSSYVASDNQYKVLETVTSLKDYGDYLLVKNADIKLAEAGKIISFNDKKTNQYFSQIKSLLNAIENSDISPIKSADVKDITDVYLNYDDRINIHIGEMDNLIEKLELAGKTLETENKNNPTQKGELNMTIYKKAYFTPATK